MDIWHAFAKVKAILPESLAETGIKVKPDDIVYWDREGCVVMLGPDAHEKARAFVDQFKQKAASAASVRSV